MGISVKHRIIFRSETHDVRTDTDKYFQNVTSVSVSNIRIKYAIDKTNIKN